MFTKTSSYMQTKFTELTDSQWEIIEKIVSHHNPRKHSLRTIVNAILWICRTGSQWRNMDSKYPPWNSVYDYFYQWSRNGIWDEILSTLVRIERQRKDREAEPSMIAIDSQSIKSSSFISSETIGIDGGKKIRGRKRHIATDSEGILIAVYVSAADVHDGVAGLELLHQIEKKTQRLALIRTDGSYTGMFKNVAENIYGWKVEAGQRPPDQKGFVPQKGRWQVERSFGWLNNFRRLAKDFEKTTASAESFIQIAAISTILARFG